jgi:hypothetical protein
MTTENQRQRVKKNFFFGLEIGTYNEVKYLIEQLQEQAEHILQEGFTTVFLALNPVPSHPKDESPIEGYLVGERWETDDEMNHRLAEAAAEHEVQEQVIDWVQLVASLRHYSKEDVLAAWEAGQKVGKQA